MEFEFDKEIDSLLRQTAKGENLFTRQNTPAGHIDADEISMFAENALPEKAKPRVTKHLADCDRCRTILSNLIALNVEEAAFVPVQETKPENVVTSTEMNWFQKLFATRNLAFGMGALALIFAVGIGFLIVQNVMSPPNAELTQANTNAASADNLAANEATDSTKMANSNSSAPADDVILSDEKESSEANMPADTAGRSPETLDDGIPGRKAPTAGKRESGERFGDNKQESSGRSGSLKRDEPSDAILSTETDADISVAEDKAKLKDGENRSRPQDDRVAANKPEPEATSPPPAPPVTVRRSNKPKPKKSAKERKDVQEENNISSGSATKRQISGKTFTRKNRVWYDSAYKGEPTTNVKRRTSQYRYLDSGLRSITDKLDGTVVLVWKSKAYRVD